MLPWTAAAEPPRLVVVVSVDQWAYRYFQWFDGRFPNNGLVDRVRQQGVWYSQCRHGHGWTKTGPGHAVLLTGTYSPDHGIVGNDWFDRDSRNTVYCVADDQVEEVGGVSGTTSASPRSLLVDTVGDQLKLATAGRAKVFGVAIKDRAAILMAGHLADGAYWMNEQGKWVTSTYYRDDLPAYMRELNERAAPRAYAQQTWNLLKSPEHYWHGWPEQSRFEQPAAGMKADFPHIMPQADDPNLVRQVNTSPFGNHATLEAALQLIFEEQLGQDDVPDLLVINLSSNDYVGHAFGPHSLEVEDMTYRTDQQLAKFIDVVQQNLAGRPWLLFATSDHGVSPIPERAAARGIPAQRYPLGDLNTLQQALESHLRAALQVDSDAPDLVAKLTDAEVYLSGDHVALAGPQRSLAQRMVGDWLIDHPAIHSVWTREQLRESEGQSDPLALSVQRSFHARRSGDVLFVLRPYLLQSGGGTTHGSPWDYDTHVPLFVLQLDGTGGSAGGRRVDQPVRPGQIAATVCHILDIPRPSACREPPLP